MSEVKQLLIIYLCIMNIFAFVMYGADKLKAKRHSWRIPENALLMSAVLGGAYGAYLGMNFFRHKTKHTYFRIINSLCCLIWSGILIIILLRA